MGCRCADGDAGVDRGRREYAGVCGGCAAGMQGVRRMDDMGVLRASRSMLFHEGIPTLGFHDARRCRARSGLLGADQRHIVHPGARFAVGPQTAKPDGSTA